MICACMALRVSFGHALLSDAVADRSAATECFDFFGVVPVPLWLAVELALLHLDAVVVQAVVD